MIWVNSVKKEWIKWLRLITCKGISSFGIPFCLRSLNTYNSIQFHFVLLSAPSFKSVGPDVKHQLSRSGWQNGWRSWISVLIAVLLTPSTFAAMRKMRSGCGACGPICLHQWAPGTSSFRRKWRRRWNERQRMKNDGQMRTRNGSRISRSILFLLLFEEYDVKYKCR